MVARCERAVEYTDIDQQHWKEKGGFSNVKYVLQVSSKKWC